MFDLPTKDKTCIKQYTKFRKYLLNTGFLMLQHSVYYRYVFNQFDIAKYISGIQMNIPPNGNIRIFSMTDIQFKSHVVIDNNISIKPEIPEAIIQL